MRSQTRFSSRGWWLICAAIVIAAVYLFLPQVLSIALVNSALTVLLVVLLALQWRNRQRLRNLEMALSAFAREVDVGSMAFASHDKVGQLSETLVEVQERLRRTLQDEKTRVEIVTKLNAVRPLDETLRGVCEELVKLQQVRAAYIAVRGNEAWDAFGVGIGLPLELPAATLFGPSSISWSIWGDADANAKVQSIAITCPLSPSAEAALGRCTLCATPIRFGTAIFGTLAIVSDGANISEHTETVRATAEQVALRFERYRILADVQYQASTDALTGLHNQRFLLDYLTQQIAIAERTSAPISVLLLDMDHLKEINDRYGHSVGDVVIQEFARAMQASVRRSDLAARYGGDEFVVVLTNTNYDDAHTVAEKLCRGVTGFEVPTRKGAVRCSVSIGGATYSVGPIDARQLIQLADDAMYVAKHAGRNQVHFAEYQMKLGRLYIGEHALPQKLNEVQHLLGKKQRAPAKARALLTQ